MKLEEFSKKAFISEESFVKELVNNADFLENKSDNIFKRARKYVENIREKSDNLSIETFLKEYSLDSNEGIAILCLAEALLRVPDSKTADELIADKLENGKWQDHLGDESGFLLNSSTYGLMLGEEILSMGNKNNILSKSVGKIISKLGEPIIRSAIKQAMKILGSRFVLGTDINLALEKSQIGDNQHYLFSYDMLGEGARTNKQAEDFYDSYLNGIKEIAKTANNIDDGELSYHAPNISIKLSALHPRYELKNKQRVLDELLPRLKNLLLEAKNSNLWVSIDAEESYRLELSLIILEELLKDGDLDNKNWQGIGFVVQAYNKRSKDTLSYIKNLSEKYKCKIPVRLVKGAYWDYEIKHAQEEGHPNYPIFTRKSHTDLSYIICSKFMLDNLDNFYPQFATHNALTVATLLEICPENNNSYEFQRLFGMGDNFYDQLVDKIPCRIYAPVGNYKELLPYLIRRILENGANSSFVNLVVDKNEPIGEILTDPVKKILNKAYTSKAVPLPSEIYQPYRINSKGYDLGNINHLEYLEECLNNQELIQDLEKQTESLISGDNIEASISASHKAFKDWSNTETKHRIKCAKKLADLIEEKTPEIIAILAYEAKKTVKDSIFEIREAVDFLRYYSSQASKLFPENKPPQLGYTGEASIVKYRPKGVFACISPWNFPLSIFIGQISAALVTGNTVIAKPAEQTSKIAYYITKLAHKAGFPEDGFQLVLGKGSEIGAQITSSNLISGVIFTGSTAVAQIINSNLAQRQNAPIATFIAETGGQNCFLIDSTALLERATDDLIESAFGSAGQKCSAARVAYIQEDIFEETEELLVGALAELEINSANIISTDSSEVIDQKAKDSLDAHIEEMKTSQRFIAAATISKDDLSKQNFVAPHIFEIDSISSLKQENFGPILHLRKFNRNNINDIIDEINSTEYGLTFGIHSRIQNFIDYVTPKIHAGNIYINRTCTGAVVETHPFGGTGLSGTGPKAGGENYLKRFLHEVTITDNTSAIGGNLELLT